MEILVSTFLIVLTLTGLIHLFVAGQRLILHSHTKMGVGELGKAFLDPLQKDVRQDTWAQATNNLFVGTRYCDSVAGHPQQQNCPARILNGIEYNATYVISDLSPNMRKVINTINWKEPTP